MSLINPEDSLEEIKNTLISTLVRAGHDRRSAFRFIIFNTIASDFPNSRYVVLRKFESESKELFIYTDYRSNKISEIKINPFVSVLAYDKQKRCQIKLKGKAKLHYQDEMAKVHWASLQAGEESYNTMLEPGKVAASLTEAHQMKVEMDDQYFAVIRLEIFQAEILQLNNEGHIRALFDFDNNDASYLVP